MSWTVHELRGCASTPLAHYLKALAVLRIVATQGGSAAQGTRGLWRAGRLVLATQLDRDQLLELFLRHYRPSPVIAPWNGGSGFFAKDNREAIDALRQSGAERFADYARGIELGRRCLGDRTEKLQGDEKAQLMATVRRRAEGPLRDWIDAAFVLASDASPKYPPMLGTGGNDGRLDYTNNFMQRLVDLLDPATGEPLPHAHPALEAALFDTPCPVQTSGSVGQFLPRGAGGANASDSFGGDALFNPWDFVLMIEGTLAFGSSVTRRADPGVHPQLAAPFVFRGSASGYGSAAPADEGGRGEQWLPLWETPSTWREVSTTLAEGRCQVGGAAAARPADVARAIGRLGVARGISAFERIGYVERLGQNNLAVPLGTWRVAPVPHIDLTDEVAAWIEALRRAGRGDHAPASIQRCARRAENALLACARSTATPTDWRRLLLTLADAESQLLRSPRFTKGAGLRPIPPLGVRWLEAAHGDSPALRLATALSRQCGVRSQGGEGVRDLLDPVRGHFIPLAKDRQNFASTADALASDPGVVLRGNAPLRELGQMVLRRSRGARQRSGCGMPLRAPQQFGASLADLRAFLRGAVDVDEVLNLARALCALRLDEDAAPPWTPGLPSADDLAGAATFGLLAAAVRAGDLPRALRLETPVPFDTEVVAALASGDLQRAGRRAARRVHAHCSRPLFRTIDGDARAAARHLAALAFPLAPADAARLRERITLQGLLR